MSYVKQPRFAHILIYVWPLLLMMTGCAIHRPPEPPLEEFVPAVPADESPPEVRIVEVPKVLPLPGQMKPLPASTDRRPASEEILAPQERVLKANAAARVEPTRGNYVNATQVWPYSPDALYQIYSSPERITDITLQEGEQVTSVSAGDTVRWIIGDTTSGEGASQRSHILIKPSRADLRTNLVIHSNRRSYHLELTSTDETWMAAVSWSYPLDQLVQLRQVNRRAESVTPIVEGLALERLNFRYEVTGDSPNWRPLRAFDDGEKVYIQFPAGIANGEMPPLFVIGGGGDAQLVNYRVRAPYYVVDRLFTTAELRLGAEKDARVVRISRVDIAASRPQ
jgi:type IV secretion system protein TrbG